MKLQTKWMVYVAFCFTMWVLFYPPNLGTGQKKDTVVLNLSYLKEKELDARIAIAEARVKKDSAIAELLLLKALKDKKKEQPVIKKQTKWRIKLRPFIVPVPTPMTVAPRKDTVFINTNKPVSDKGMVVYGEPVDSARNRWLRAEMIRKANREGTILKKRDEKH